MKTGTERFLHAHNILTLSLTDSMVIMAYNKWLSSRMPTMIMNCPMRFCYISPPLGTLSSTVFLGRSHLVHTPFSSWITLLLLACTGQSPLADALDSKASHNCCSLELSSSETTGSAWLVSSTNCSHGSLSWAGHTRRRFSKTRMVVWSYQPHFHTAAQCSMVHKKDVQTCVPCLA